MISSVSVKIKMTKYDLVIYGASGFTGQFVIEYVHRAAKEHQVRDPTSILDEGMSRDDMYSDFLGSGWATRGEAAGCRGQGRGCGRS